MKIDPTPRRGGRHEASTPPTPVRLPGPTDYALLDSGGQQKLERFGPIVLARPAAQAIWPPAHPGLWADADASFSRRQGGGWEGARRLPPAWIMEADGLQLKLSATDFGHLGVFPEQHALWRWLDARVRQARAAGRTPNLLNLFAYSGVATIAMARAGAEVCHLDAARGMVAWARENAALSGLDAAPIRWIVDDAVKFLEREARRGRGYDGIVLHPPSFGRGPKGEVFKIEDQIVDLLALCRSVLTPRPLLVAVAVHTAELTPTVVHHLLEDMMRGVPGGQIAAEEMLCTGAPGLRTLPNGVSGRWWADAT